MGVTIRNTRAEDYKKVLAVMDDWWGGRNLSDKLPKLFFEHFQNTSFIAEDNGRIVGFLIGFVSQTHPAEAYIHFVGVDPDYRQCGQATLLYNRFFDTVRSLGCRTVRCVTAPVNKGSIEFHKRMGFQIAPGDGEVDGVPVSKDVDGRGNDRVLFVKTL